MKALRAGSVLVALLAWATWFGNSGTPSPAQSSIVVGANASEAHLALSALVYGPPFVTTTTTVPAPPVRPQKASRALVRPRPPEPPPSVPVAAPEGCNSWAMKTRAESDSCWYGWIAQWQDWDAWRMLRILYCESRGNPFAKNPHSGAAGLLQVIGGSIGDGPSNIALGHDVWQRGGYSRWSCK